MSRLPIVGFKEMERLLLRLGFESVRQRGVIFSIGTLMVGLLHSLNILAKI